MPQPIQKNLQSRTTNKLLQRTAKRKHVQQEGFLGEPKRHSVGTRVAHPDSREHPAHILDDEAWLSDAQSSETGFKGDTLGNNVDGLLAGVAKAAAWDRTPNPQISKSLKKG
eukprot:1938277-Amphidinium_carterae.1